MTWPMFWAGAGNMARLVVIAAGGTGGHMFPAQALAEELLARGWQVKLSTDARGARYASGFPDAVAREVVKSATTARGGLLGKALVVPRILAGAWAARRSFKRNRPDIVIGFGGYPAVPAMLAAWALRLPRMIHEQNGVLGRVNTIFAPRVSAVACGTWPTSLPKGVAGVNIGNPVRAAIKAKAGAAYIPPGDYPMSLLMLGGSQGARILSQIVPTALASLPEDLRSRIRIAHQARPEDEEAVVAAYAAAGIKAEVKPFFSDIPTRMSEAQLVISRAGASSLADLSVIGRPAILVPFAAATGDHQSANAAPFVAAGAAIVLAETALTADTLMQHIRDILADEGRAKAMAAAALALGQPKAATQLADLVESTATQEQP